MNSRAPSITVKRQTSAAVTSIGEKNPETTPVSSEDSVSDQLAKLKEENAKLKTKLKKEEESRKHWQDTCKKRDEEVSDAKKEKEMLEKTIEAERGNAKKYQAQLLSKSERLKYLEKKDGKTAVTGDE
jgi:chromosome segregation ATPase